MEKMKNQLEQVKIKLIRDNPLASEKQITCISDAADLLSEFMSDLDRETFCVVNLDNKMRPINFNIVSIGSLNQSLVHPREVFKTSILSNANSVILAHNHPSGDTKPSNEDLLTTRRLIKAGEILGIPVRDHFIIGYNESENKAIAHSLRENKEVDFEVRYQLVEMELER